MELVEIKKGEIGKGLLIENDGFISIDSTPHNRQLRESFEESNEWFVPKPFVVDAVFQKYGVKNANGRIYPERILKREVEKYQERIRNHNAYGECYKPDAMILTEEGWKTLEEVKVGENVLTLNLNTNEIEIQAIEEKIEHDFDGDMIHIYNRNINDVVTPGHEYIIFDRSKDVFKGRIKASELLNGNGEFSDKDYIPRRGKWIGRDDEYFVIDNIDDEKIVGMKSNIKEKYSGPLKFKMLPFAKFMGIYLSEGSCDKNDDGSRVMIYQRKEETIEEIKEMLDELGIKYTVEKRVNQEDGKDIYIFVICDMRLCKYLQQFGLCYDKYVPFELKQQNKETLTAFYEWYVKGDGRIRGDRKQKNGKLTTDAFSTSKRLVLDINEIQLKIGACGNYHVEARDNDRYIGDRLIEGKNCRPMHFTLKSTVRKGVTLDKRYLHRETEHYKGKVICVNVPNHNFYVMCNDKTHWTSNCNHPSESTIDLGRISHNITELHWEGCTLVGKMELNISEGFRRFGICSSLGDTCALLLLNGYLIGVSSRAVGSVEQKMGVTVVGDDLEIICWDIVSDNSTPGAKISIHGPEELQQYIESDKTKSGKSMLSEKLDKISKLL